MRSPFKNRGKQRSLKVGGDGRARAGPGQGTIQPSRPATRQHFMEMGSITTSISRPCNPDRDGRGIFRQIVHLWEHYEGASERNRHLTRGHAYSMMHVHSSRITEPAPCTHRPQRADPCDRGLWAPDRKPPVVAAAGSRDPRRTANSLPFRHHPPNPTQSHAQDGKNWKNFASPGLFRDKIRQIGDNI